MNFQAAGAPRLGVGEMNKLPQTLGVILFLASVISLAAYAAKLSPAQIAQSTGPATVVIKAKLAGGNVSTGSGFVADPSGVVVTNYHVVQGAHQIQIRFPSGDVYEVTGTRGVDEKKDIAVLQISGFDLPVAKLGNSNRVRTGERIVVLGTALGMLENTVTTGVISGIRQLEGFRVFQMDAAVSQGNSGGPVVNEQGEVIAVTVFKLTGGESLNFAVPINYARGLLRSQVAGGLTKLAVTEPGQPLFGEPAERLPRRWKGLNSIFTRIVRQEGTYIYVETIWPDPETHEEFIRLGGMMVAELQRREGEDKWVGTTRHLIPCVWKKRWKVCGFEWRMQISLLSPSRIEGSLMGPRPQGKLDCKRCDYLAEMSYIPLTWIPE